MIDVSEHMDRLDFLADWVAICAQRKINLLREMNFILETGWVLGFHYYYPNAKTFDEYVEHRRRLKFQLSYGGGCHDWVAGVDPYRDGPKDIYFIPDEPFNHKNK